MIDNFSLALTHVLLLVVAWRILMRPDLDEDVPAKTTEAPAGEGGGDA